MELGVVGGVVLERMVGGGVVGHGGERMNW